MDENDDLVSRISSFFKTLDGRKVFDLFKEYGHYLPAILLIITTIGYLKFQIAFFQYEIDISKFLVLNDLVFATIGIVLMLLITAGIYFLVYLIFLLGEKIKSFFKISRFQGFSLFFLVITIGAISFFVYVTGYSRSYAYLFTMKYFLAITVIIIITLSFKFYKVKEFAIALVFIIAYFYVFANIKTNRDVKFISSGMKYSTQSDSLRFVGETSNYIFLFNEKKESMLSFHRENCSEVEYYFVDELKELRKETKKLEEQLLRLKKKSR